MLFAFEEGFSVGKPTQINCHLYLIGVLKYRSLNIAEILKLRDFYKTLLKYLEGHMKYSFLAGSKEQFKLCGIDNQTNLLRFNY